ncbi:hypothetical protein ACQ4PT_046585 [Festuca glaucescens]
MNLPVIGSLHHLASTKLAHHALLRLSRQHGPLMLLKLGEMSTVIASTPEAAMEVLKTNDLALRPVRAAPRWTSSAAAAKASSSRPTASTGGRCARYVSWSFSARSRCGGWTPSSRTRWRTSSSPSLPLRLRSSTSARRWPS